LHTGQFSWYHHTRFCQWRQRRFSQTFQKNPLLETYSFGSLHHLQLFLYLLFGLFFILDISGAKKAGHPVDVPLPACPAAGMDQ
jgi:hypothetical protein